MRICTLESSLFPLCAGTGCLHLPPLSPCAQHTVHVRAPRKHIICQRTHLHNEHQRKKDIFTPESGAVFNKHSTLHKTQ